MDVLSLTDEQFSKRLHSHLSKIYSDTQVKGLVKDLQYIFEDTQTNSAQKVGDAQEPYWNGK